MSLYTTLIVCRITPKDGAKIYVNGELIKETSVMKSGNRIIFGKHHVFLFINPLEVRKARESSHARKAEVVKQRGRDRSRARSAHTVVESEERDSSPDSDDIKREKVKKVAGDNDNSDDDVEDNDDAIMSNDDSDIASEMTRRH